MSPVFVVCLLTTWQSYVSYSLFLGMKINLNLHVRIKIFITSLSQHERMILLDTQLADSAGGVMETYYGEVRTVHHACAVVFW